MKANQYFNMYYLVSYNDLEGNDYEIEVNATNEYEATCVAARKVNGNRNFGFNFKARIHPTK